MTELGDRTDATATMFVIVNLVVAALLGVLAWSIRGTLGTRSLTIAVILAAVGSFVFGLTACRQGCRYPGRDGTSPGWLRSLHVIAAFVVAVDIVVAPLLTWFSSNTAATISPPSASLAWRSGARRRCCSPCSSISSRPGGGQTRPSGRPARSPGCSSACCGSWVTCGSSRWRARSCAPVGRRSWRWGFGWRSPFGSCCDRAGGTPRRSSRLPTANPPHCGRSPTRRAGPSGSARSAAPPRSVPIWVTR